MNILLKLVVNSMVISCLDYCNCLYYGIAEKAPQSAAADSKCGGQTDYWQI